MIQPYSLGTTVTRIDGANLATGTISADSAIIKGTLSADTITAGSVTASSLFIPSLINGLNGGTAGGGTLLSGDAIRTGKVSADCLDISGIATFMNNGSVTKINGGAITCDSLLAAKITTQGLDADAIKAGKLVAGRIDVDGLISLVNGGTTTKITAAGITVTGPGSVVASLNSINGGSSNTQITGSGISCDTVLANKIQTQGLDAIAIKTGSLESIGVTDTDRTKYETYNWAKKAAKGFKLSHDAFPVLNQWQRSQYVQAEFGTNIMVGGLPLGPVLNLPLNAFFYTSQLDQMDENTRLFYRGNNVTTSDVRYGTPNIACLKVYPGCIFTLSGVTNTANWLFTITPTTYATANDNLDAMRYMRVRLYQYSYSVTPFADFGVPLPDRLYDGGTGGYNGGFVWQWRSGRTYLPTLASSPMLEAGSNQFSGYMRCTLFNASGASSDAFFGPSATEGSALTAASTTVPPDPPPPRPPSGDPITGCVPAGTLMLTASGLASIESLCTGTQVVAYDEHTLEPVEASIVNLFKYTDREMYKISTNLGYLICSHDHRFTRQRFTRPIGLDSIDFPPARDLNLNDVLAVYADGKIVYAFVSEIISLGYSDTVYHAQLDKGHVFVAGGFLAHNTQMKIKTELLNT